MWPGPHRQAGTMNTLAVSRANNHAENFVGPHLVLKMDDQLTLRVKSDFAEIPTANEAVSRWLAERNAPPALDYHANLALEELVTNCIKYGYADAAQHVIEVELKLSATEMVLTVTDDGLPFNPLAQPEPDTSLPVEDRPIGGLGIHLLRKMSDRMEYERRGEKNQVTIRKSLGAQKL